MRFRRHYQVETRKLASEAGARYTAIAASEADLRVSADALALTDADNTSPVLRQLRERFPSLVDRGPAAFEAPSFDRSRIMQVRGELEVEQRRVESELAERARQVRQIEEGEQHLQAGRARAALQIFEQIAREQPTSRRAADLVARCGPAAREMEATEGRTEEVMARASEAQQMRDWPRVISLCDEVIALVPGLPSAVSMRGEAVRAIAREQRRKELLLQQALERASAAIDEERFDEAEAALHEIEGIDTENPAVAQLRDDLASARFAAERAEYLRRLIDDGIRRARSAFRRGRYDEAVAQLRDLAARQGAQGAADEADRLDALRDRLAHGAQERRQQVIAAVSAARAAADSGSLDEAVARARVAVKCDSTDLEASALLDELTDRRLTARLEQEQAHAAEGRAHDAEPMLAAAREASRRGYVSTALAAALSASRVAPDRDDISQLIEELRQVTAAEDAETFDLTEEPFGVAVKPAPVATPAPAVSTPVHGSAPTAAATPAGDVTPPPRDGGLLSQLRKRLGNK